ncbi:MAG: DUF188 domain-containing protein [Methylotenera sp.]|nr:MAG: DUF188 domain-containing protein [Methylotenera sp.]
MKIWVDADACPVVIKEILYRAATRTGIETILVANTWLRVPPSPHIRAVQVDKGFDVADNYIVQAVEVSDLVITADIPLAAQVVAIGAHALNPRGEMYTSANIAERLAMRDMMDELRSQGAEISGPAAFNQADRQKFAAELDRFMARHIVNK